MIGRLNGPSFGAFQYTLNPDTSANRRAVADILRKPPIDADTLFMSRAGDGKNAYIQQAFNFENPDAIARDEATAKEALGRLDCVQDIKDASDVPLNQYQ